MMKILFVCGSLEYGRDGVGDYTRRLAGELLRQGQQAIILALHDPFIYKQEPMGTQRDGEQRIATLRLSNRLSWTDRVRQASAFIKTIDPDWISLQYVPFSFHEKGLSLALSNVMKKLSGNKPVHIMFHELWVGMSTQSPKRHVWWGEVQRYLIRSLLRTLRPQVVHTHTHLYLIHLEKLGIQAALLPLFSNIPQISKIHNDSTPNTMEKEHRLKFVFFGGIAPETPAEALAEEIAFYAGQHKLAIDLTIMGRSGAGQEAWATAWRTHNLAVQILGEQSPASIANVLNHSSIGLSTTPTILSGKSGAIAAMHAHGLPVLCVSGPWQPRNRLSSKATSGVVQYTVGNFKDVINILNDLQIPSVSVSGVAQHLLRDLSTNH